MRQREYSYKIYALILALFVGIAGAITAGAIKQGEILAQEASAQVIQQGIAQEVLRFHVLANSDSEEDQQLKLQVKTAVVSYLEGMLPEDVTLEETRNLVKTHMEEISHRAKEVIQKEGYAYPVTVSLTETYFPEKTYGDCTLPAGEYEALQVKIGEAEGQNWWCVLYPGLCFLDETHAVVKQEKMQKLRQVLTVEEYETITKDADIKIRFRWLKR